MPGPFPDLQPMTPVMSPLQLTLARNQMAASNALTPLDIAQAQLNYQQSSDLAPLIVQQRKAEVAQAQANAARSGTEASTASALAPYTIQEAGQTSELKTQDYNKSLLADVANRAYQQEQSGDPQAAIQTWDQGMQALADKGIPGASQYVSHYRKDLAQSMSSVGGGGAAGGKAGAAAPNAPDPDAVTRAVQTIPPQQLEQRAATYDKVIQAFDRINDTSAPGTVQEKWDAEVQALQKAGIPLGQQLASLQYSPANFALAARAIDSMRPYSAEMNRQLTAQKTGVPQAQPPALFQPGARTILGYDKDQRPIIADLDPNTGKPRITTGPPGVSPRPSAGAMTFGAKVDFLTKPQSQGGVGLSAQQAAEYLRTGRGGPTPQQMDLAIEREARQRYYDEFTALNRDPPPEGSEAWIQNTAQTLKATITQGIGAPAAAPARNLSQQDIQASLTNARAALAKHPDQRATIINRLRAAGVPTDGL